MSLVPASLNIATIRHTLSLVSAISQITALGKVLPLTVMTLILVDPGLASLG